MREDNNDLLDILSDASDPNKTDSDSGSDSDWSNLVIIDLFNYLLLLYIIIILFNY